MTSISIKCNEAKIEAIYYKEFTVELNGISGIEGNVDDILTHLTPKEIADYKKIVDVLDEIDDEKLLNYIGESSIIDYVLNDSNMIVKLLEMIDDKYIIGQARKIKIEKLQNEE